MTRPSHIALWRTLASRLLDTLPHVRSVGKRWGPFTSKPGPTRLSFHSAAWDLRRPPNMVFYHSFALDCYFVGYSPFSALCKQTLLLEMFSARSGAILSKDRPITAFFFFFFFMIGRSPHSMPKENLQPKVAGLQLFAFR